MLQTPVGAHENPGHPPAGGPAPCLSSGGYLARPMTDRERFEQLIRARHRCIRIVTNEESEALRLVRETAIDLQADVLVWSAVRGVTDGLLAGSLSEANTENPAAGLFRL